MKLVKKKPVEKRKKIVTFACDPSPNGTAVVKYEDDTLVDFIFFSKLKKWGKTHPKQSRLVRPVKIGEEEARVKRSIDTNIEVEEFVLGDGIDWENPPHIGIEDYVWGSGKNSGGLYQIGELGILLRITLAEIGPLRTYDPVTVKLARCGKGNASKEDMMSKALEELEDSDCPVVTDLNDLVTEKDLIPPLPGKKKSGYGPFADVADAMGVSFLLRKELAFRRGETMLSEMPEHLVKVFSRVTKAQPNCLIDRPFMNLQESE